MWFYLLAIILVPVVLAVVSFALDNYGAGQTGEMPDMGPVTLERKRAA